MNSQPVLCTTCIDSLPNNVHIQEAIVLSETPQLEWSALPRLLSLCVQFAEEKHKNGTIDIHEAMASIGKELGIEDIDTYSAELVQKTLREGIGFAFENADAKAIAAIFIKNSKPVMTVIAKFAQGAINEKELVQTLNGLCFSSASELQTILQKSLHIPDALADSIADVLGPYTVSVYCFAAAFKIYKTAAADAKAAKERRIEAERLANEAIAQLKSERAEMEKLLSAWMLERIIPFSEGAQAMDRAILEDDDDAYIAANAQLWELFGRKAAYSNATEFDELMLSDATFKL